MYLLQKGKYPTKKAWDMHVAKLQDLLSFFFFFLSVVKMGNSKMVSP